MRRLAVVCAILGLILSACGRKPPSPNSLEVVREYGWPVMATDPEPRWNPINYQVLVRAPGGFAILEEGGGRQEYYESKQKKDFRKAAWIDGDRFVVGPDSNILVTDDGRVVANTAGVLIVQLIPNRPVSIQEVGLVGFRPRPWRNEIVAQLEGRIIIYDSGFNRRDFGLGFYPEPQRNGPGLAWQETPVFEEDRWTAKPALSNLVIRWENGVTTTIEHAVQPRWTKDGGLFAVKLKSLPKPGDLEWWKVGTTLVYSKNARTKPVIIHEDWFNVDPHPVWPIIVANDLEGRVIAKSLIDGGERVMAEQGMNPRWSGDGRRLMFEELLLTGSNAGKTYLRVMVIGLKDKQELKELSPETK